MSETSGQLLPLGLYDLLPPDARKESLATERLLCEFARFGYAQVTPPLLEFERTLRAGRGETLATQTFRVMDPQSKEMMGFRADITLQVARIAASRLRSAPRPLRLCYAGPILRVAPEALQGERQLTQAGIELFGPDSPEADAEAMIVAAESLDALGIKDITLDLNLPGLLGELCPEAQSDAKLRRELREAIQRKDVALLSRLKLAAAPRLAELGQAAGPALQALGKLAALGMKDASRLARVAELVGARCPDVALSVDPLEYRGFDYHRGIGFSMFVGGLRHELGRGGRYAANGESATGFTFYVTHLLRLLPEPPAEKRSHVFKPEEGTAQ